MHAGGACRRGRRLYGDALNADVLKCVVNYVTGGAVSVSRRSGCRRVESLKPRVASRMTIILRRVCENPTSHPRTYAARTVDSECCQFAVANFSTMSRL